MQAPARPKQKPKKKGLTSFRWSVGFEKAEGATIKERCDARGMPVGIWIREAALDRLARDIEREGIERSARAKAAAKAAAKPGPDDNA